MPYKIVEQIAYDPTARDLSVEVAKAKATGAEALLMVSRLNDAILITRELVKQRWTPMAMLSMGPGWYEDQYLKTLGKLSDGPMSFVPWYDPNKKLSKLLEAALAKAHPDINLNTNHIYTFEALLVAADAYKRAGSTDPKALADAIRTTNITDNVSIGPGIQFDAKGQNDKLKNAAIQNRGGKLVTVAPEGARPTPSPNADDRPTTSAVTPGASSPAWGGRGRVDEASLSARALNAAPDGHGREPAEIYLNVAVSGLLTGLVYGLMALGPVGHLRRGARGQLRPRRDDDDRDVPRDRAVRRLRARSAGDAGADRRACCSRSAMRMQAGSSTRSSTGPSTASSCCWSRSRSSSSTSC